MFSSFSLNRMFYFYLTLGKEKISFFFFFFYSSTIHFTDGSEHCFNLCTQMQIYIYLYFPFMNLSVWFCCQRMKLISFDHRLLGISKRGCKPLPGCALGWLAKLRTAEAQRLSHSENTLSFHICFELGILCTRTRI